MDHRLVELARKFERAAGGGGGAEITQADLDLLGINLQRTFRSARYGTIRVARNWPNFCAFVFERLTGRPHPGSRRAGRRRRHADFGRAVADAVRERARQGPDDGPYAVQ